MAVGTAALVNNDASANAAFGAYALHTIPVAKATRPSAIQRSLITPAADFNTAIGDSALLSNTIGFINTGIGVGALQFNTTGYANVALGNFAGINVSTAHNVVCISSGGDNVDNTTGMATFR